MPIIQVNMREGRSDAQKRAMAKAITEAVTHTLGAKPESVRILIHELGPVGFFVAGEATSPSARPPNGADGEIHP